MPTSPRQAAWLQCEGWCCIEAPTQQDLCDAAAAEVWAGGTSEDVETKGKECLKTGGGGGWGSEGKRARVQGRTSVCEESTTQTRQHFASDLVPAETSSLAGSSSAFAGWGSRTWSQLLAADVCPALAGAPECLSQGEGVLLGWISCKQLLGFARGTEQKAGGLDTWHVFHFCPVSLEDVSCAALS